MERVAGSTRPQSGETGSRATSGGFSHPCSRCVQVTISHFIPYYVILSPPNDPQSVIHFLSPKRSCLGFVSVEIGLYLSHLDLDQGFNCQCI